MDEVKLTYKVSENGYDIYRENDPDYGMDRPWITQHEPYIPNKELSYEENAKAQIAELEAVMKVSTQEQEAIDVDAKVEDVE